MESHADDTFGLTKRLLATTDARVWAAEWLAVISAHPDVPFDEGTMIGWFANAIEVGRSAGQRPDDYR